MRLSLSVAAALSFMAAGAPAQTRVDAIAAGDATETTAIAWVRAADGPAPASLRLQVATDPGWLNIVQAHTVATTPAADFTAKVALSGLRPGTRHYYRFCGETCDAARVGMFNTAPPADTAARVRFGFSGDADGRYRPYPLIADIARENLDFFVFLGDTIYETAAKGSRPTRELFAETNTEGVAAGLVDYNRKYLENVQGVAADGTPSNQGQLGLLPLLAATGTYTLLDNHELGNRALQAGGAPPGLPGRNTDPAFDVNTTGRFNHQAPAYKAMEKAFYDYHPTRVTIGGSPAAGFTVNGPAVDQPDDPRLHGTPRNWFAQQWGAHVLYVQTDARSYRDARLGKPGGFDDTGPRADNPGRTMLGRAQLAWLKATLLAAQQAGTAWKFVAVSSPIDQIGRPVPLPDGKGVAPGTQFADGKSWDGGYRAERHDLLRFIADNRIDNVVFLTTDDHFVRITTLRYGTGDGGTAPVPGAFQILTGPIGAGGPDGFPSHDCATIAKAMDLRNAVLQEMGQPVNGLPAEFGNVTVLHRRCGPPGGPPQPLDFFIPDQFAYTTIDVDGSGRLTVETIGMDAYQANMFPANADAQRVMSFQVEPRRRADHR